MGLIFRPTEFTYLVIVCDKKIPTSLPLALSKAIKLTPSLILFSIFATLEGCLYEDGCSTE